MSSNNHKIEFSHIEVRVVRNPEWLEPYEKSGWFLSEDFPIASFELPPRFFDMNEGGLDKFKEWFIPKFARYFGVSRIMEES